MQDDLKPLDLNYIFLRFPRSPMTEYHGANKLLSSQGLHGTHIVHHNYDTWGELIYDWSDLLILPFMFIVCVGFMYAIAYGWEYGWKWWQRKKHNASDVERCLQKGVMNNEFELNVVAPTNVAGDESKSFGGEINETWYSC